MGGFAWVTLATNDSYSLGALVLAHSLKQAGTNQQLVVLVTPGVTNPMREKLASVFNVVQEVNILDSKDEANLRLLKRPELGVTFTKLHCWRLTQFDKCVFLDADTLVLQNCDELFDREELSAAPDVGWPDCFNSGVFVYRPSNETYEKLVQFALERGSFDGGDQGLLNLYFSDWATKDISKHLPFIYNLCSTACYSYLPAFKQFGADAKIIHFIGATKPWLQYFNTETKKVQPSGDLKHLEDVLQHWWNIFCSLIHPNLTPNMARSSSDVMHTNVSRYIPKTHIYSQPESPKNEIWDPWDEYDQTHSIPIHQTQSVPVHQTQSIPMHQTQSIPVHQTQSIPMHQTQSFSFHHTEPVTVYPTPLPPPPPTPAPSFQQYQTQSIPSTFSSHLPPPPFYQHHQKEIISSHQIHEPSREKPIESHNTNAHYIASHQNIPSPNVRIPEISNWSHSHPQPQNSPQNVFSGDQSYTPPSFNDHPKTVSLPPVQNNYHIPQESSSSINSPKNSVVQSVFVEFTPKTTDPIPTVLPSDCEAAATVCKETTLHTPLCEDESDAGLAGAFAQLTLGAPRTAEQIALDDHLRRQGWEVGNIDYLGRDSFDNIWSKICETLSAGPPPPAPKPKASVGLTKQEISSSAPAAPPQETTAGSSVAPIETQKTIASEISQPTPETVPQSIPSEQLKEAPVTESTPSADSSKIQEAPSSEGPQCPIPPKTQETTIESPQCPLIPKPQEASSTETPQCPLVAKSQETLPAEEAPALKQEAPSTESQQCPLPPKTQESTEKPAAETPKSEVSQTISEALVSPQPVPSELPPPPSIPTPPPETSPVSASLQETKAETPVLSQEPPVQLQEAPSTPKEIPIPVQETPAPPQETPSPAQEIPAPAQETPAPAAETPAPAQETPTPVQETPAPAQETPAPAQETPAPGPKTVAPAPETPAPAQETPAPAQKTPAPAPETVAPAQETPAPAQETPVPAQETPAPAQETPAPAQETPAPAQKTPAPAQETPTPVQETPAPVQEIPTPVKEASRTPQKPPSSSAPAPALSQKVSAPLVESVVPQQPPDASPLPTQSPPPISSKTIPSSQSVPKSAQSVSETPKVAAVSPSSPQPAASPETVTPTPTASAPPVSSVTPVTESPKSESKPTQGTPPEAPKSKSKEKTEQKQSSETKATQETVQGATSAASPTPPPRKGGEKVKKSKSKK